jgi:hypothetical protein
MHCMCFALQLQPRQAHGQPMMDHEERKNIQRLTQPQLKPACPLYRHLPLVPQPFAYAYTPLRYTPIKTLYQEDQPPQNKEARTAR